MLKLLITGRGDDSREVLKKMLEDGGYACVFVREGAKVVDTVYNELPDIIMLDLELSLMPWKYCRGSNLRLLQETLR